MSRDRDCCDLTEISGISGGRLIFGCRMDLDHFLAWRAGTNSRYSTGESPPIKAEWWEPTLHLETTCSRFNTSTRRRTCSSAGPGRSQQLEILSSLNSKEFFSGPPTFPAKPGFPWTLVFYKAQGFYHSPNFHQAQGFYHPPNFHQAQGFYHLPNFQQAQGFYHPPNFHWPQGFYHPPNFHWPHGFSHPLDFY